MILFPFYWRFHSGSTDDSIPILPIILLSFYLLNILLPFYWWYSHSSETIVFWIQFYGTLRAQCHYNLWRYHIELATGEYHMTSFSLQLHILVYFTILVYNCRPTATSP